jgi:hypothetical protein
MFDTANLSEITTSTTVVCTFAKGMFAVRLGLHESDEAW